jgi:hypothetical protein
MAPWLDAGLDTFFSTHLKSALAESVLPPLGQPIAFEIEGRTWVLLPGAPWLAREHPSPGLLIRASEAQLRALIDGQHIPDREEIEMVGNLDLLRGLVRILTAAEVER